MKKVFVAMSGGVDSSVAAALLKKRRFLPAGRQVNVVGVFMKPWQPKMQKYRNAGISSCLWKQDREDALRVAAKLDIPLLTWDLSKEYEKRVVRYMIQGYKKGITPNPDVMCNKFIKFGVFLDKALELGADYIATGHYVRLEVQVSRGSNSSRSFSTAPAAVSEGVGRFVPPEREPSQNGLQPARRTTSARHTYYKLLKAKDSNKDQSYFLYALAQEQLKRCFFPIGDYTKDEVREMAKKFGLPNWDKKDSQGVCFVGPLAMDKFLKKHIRPRKGKVVRQKDGQVLGEHDGVWYYTIGQRHGFGLNGGQPYYVVGKDVKKNILYVDEEVRSKKLEVRVKDFNWIGGEKRLPMKCKVKTRYRQKDLDSTIVRNGGSIAHAKISAKNIAIAPGQSAVFYKGNEVLGGGVIV